MVEKELPTVSLRHSLRFTRLISVFMFAASAPVAIAAQQSTMAPAQATNTTTVPDRVWRLSELAFVPEEYRTLEQQREALFSSSFTPIATFEIGAEFPEKLIGNAPNYPQNCRARSGLVHITYKPSDVPSFNGLKPVEYRGNSVSCQPSGFGVITYENGARWVGNVSAAADRNAPVNEWRGTTGWGAIARPDGVGIIVRDPARTFPIQIQQVSTQNDVNRSPWANIVKLTAFQNIPNSYVRRLDGRTPNGNVVYHFPSGGRLTATLEDGRVVGTDGGNDFWDASGNRVRGDLARIVATGPIFNEVRFVELVSARNGFPAGQYTVDKRALGQLASGSESSRTISAGAALRFIERLAYAPVTSSLSTILRGNLSNQWGCKEPEFMPQGWVIWWPGCTLPSSANPNGGLTLFSPDGAQSLTDVSDRSGRRVSYQANGIRIVADNFIWDNTYGLTAVNPKPRINYIDGIRGIIFTGNLQGIRPVGEGICEHRNYDVTPAQDVIETCTWSGGVRNDPVFLADVKVKEAKATARRLAEEAARQLRLAQEAEARVLAEYEAQRAEEARQRQLAEDRRIAREEARQAELARQRRNQAIAQAFAAVGQAAAQSIYENGRQQAITNNQIAAARTSQQYGRYVPPAPPPPTYQEMQQMEQIRRQYGTVYGSAASRYAANTSLERDRLRAASDSRVRQARERATTIQAEARSAQIEVDRVAIVAQRERETAAEYRAIAEQRAHDQAAQAAQMAQAEQRRSEQAATQAALQSANSGSSSGSTSSAPLQSGATGSDPASRLYLTVVRAPPPPPPPPPVARAPSTATSPRPPPPPPSRPIPSRCLEPGASCAAPR